MTLLPTPRAVLGTFSPRPALLPASPRFSCLLPSAGRGGQVGASPGAPAPGGPPVPTTCHHQLRGQNVPTVETGKGGRAHHPARSHYVSTATLPEGAVGPRRLQPESRRDQDTKARGPVVTGCHPHWAPKPSVVGTESGFSVYLFSPPTWRLAPGTGSLGGPGVAGAPREGGRAELLGVHARVSPGASGPGSASTFPEGAERAGRVHWDGAGRPHRKCGNALLSEQEMDRAFFHPVPKS